MLNVKNDSFKSIIFQGEEDDIRVNEGDIIEFISEGSGQIIQGGLTKICGSKKERKLQILPMQSEREELWSVNIIADGSLKVIKRLYDFDNDESEE